METRSSGLAAIALMHIAFSLRIIAWAVMLYVASEVALTIIDLTYEPPAVTTFSRPL